MTAMDNYYEKVRDPQANGAVFAAVCRGKVKDLEIHINLFHTSLISVNVCEHLKNKHVQIKIRQSNTLSDGMNI